MDKATSNVGDTIIINCEGKFPYQMRDKVYWYRRRLDQSHDVIGLGDDIRNPLFKGRVKPGTAEMDGEMTVFKLEITSKYYNIMNFYLTSI